MSSGEAVVLPFVPFEDEFMEDGRRSNVMATAVNSTPPSLAGQSTMTSPPTLEAFVCSHNTQQGCTAGQ